MNTLADDGSAIDIYHVGLLQPLADLLLSENDPRAARRFRFEQDRRRFVVCRSALRRILGRHVGVPAKQVVFSYEPLGKPYLAGSKIQFNVSHSGDDALIAFVHGREIGIDIERPDARLNPDELIAHFLNPSEKAFVESGASENRLAAFLSCWTRKEAWAKAIGTGLTEDPRRFDVSASLHSATCAHRPSHRDDVDDHRIAACEGIDWRRCR